MERDPKREGRKFSFQVVKKELIYWDEFDMEEGGKDKGQKMLGLVWVFD